VYYLLACADGPALILEDKENNNCRKSAEKVTVRKGRENYLCLLNFEEAARLRDVRASEPPSPAIVSAVTRRLCVARHATCGELFGRRASSPHPAPATPRLTRIANPSTVFDALAPRSSATPAPMTGTDSPTKSATVLHTLLTAKN
jgi:hypothetical protein